MWCVHISILIIASKSWKGTWRSPSPAHTGALSSAHVTDKHLASLWTHPVLGSSLFCTATDPITGTHPSSGIFLIFSCHLSPGDIQPLLRLYLEPYRTNLSPLRHVISCHALLLLCAFNGSWHKVASWLVSLISGGNNLAYNCCYFPPIENKVHNRSISELEFFVSFTNAA